MTCEHSVYIGGHRVGQRAERRLLVITGAQTPEANL